MGNVVIKGKVVDVINNMDVAINKGFEDGVKTGSRFLVYRLGEEMFDPDTNESLGNLELVCGEGEPLNIQEHLTTLRSCKTESVQRRFTEGSPYLPYWGQGEVRETEKRRIPFEDVEKGCLVRQIR